MKLRAKLMGFYNGRRVRPGDVFEFTGKKCPKWAEPAETSKPKALPPKPVALSEMAKADAKAVLGDDLA